MKIRTASVVAVIVAAVLILSGIIVCAVGSAAAKSSGVMIYPEDENGNSVYKYDFTEKNITKISVSVKDSDITVTHGGTSSYIEIRNFNANYYKLSTENNILSFSEIDNVASMFKFWEGGFSFKGMRYLFRFGDGGRGMKTVTVNIADTSMLKTVSVSEESGSFSLTGADVSADYILSLGKASADISGLSTTSVLSVSSSAGASMKISDCRAKEFSLSGGGGSLSLSGISADRADFSLKSGEIVGENVAFTELSSSSESASLDLRSLDVSKASLNSVSGQVALRLSSDLKDFAVELAAKNASVFLNDVHYSNSYSIPNESAEKSITVNTDTASILLNAAK